MATSQGNPVQTGSYGKSKQKQTQAIFKNQAPESSFMGIKTRGGLANNLVPKNSLGRIDIMRDYPWTLSNLLNLQEIPYIGLKEYEVNESTLKRQMMFYARGVGDLMGIGSSRGVLGPYDEIFPKDRPTKWKYYFPYFSDSNYELTTSEWATLEGIGKAASGASSGVQDILKGAGREGLAKGLNIAEQAGGLLMDAGELALKAQYPLVGIADRPRMFQNHSARSINIEFYLYNTKNPDDWIKNRNFLYLFMSQNLFNKQNFILGIPPVFYEVAIPGQYYSYASSVTKIDVKNIGNVRRLYDDEGIPAVVPDAYKFTTTLVEMVMPSKNLLEATRNGEAESNVDSFLAPSALNEQQAKDLLTKGSERLAKTLPTIATNNKNE